jgi:oxidase EvaA
MIASWIQSRRIDAPMHVSPLEWSHGRDWMFDMGVLKHRTGGFFSIEGIKLDRRFEDQYPVNMPIINQPEIGVLAFLITRTPEGPRWLLQAKAEPGSEGYVQVGPTVQATQSNYLRRHGGEETAYLEYVTGDRQSYLSWSQQSEQGSRFLGKFNSNIVCEIDEEIAPHNRDWKWVDCQTLRSALAQDYIVNTDARSVLVSSDWRYLCEDGQPFSSKRSGPQTTKLSTDWGSLTERELLFHSY